MRKTLVLALVAVVCLAGSSGAFDGRRRGFVLGGGLGLATTASYSTTLNLGHLGRIKVDESGSGLGLNFVIGGAFNERNMLVYEGNVAGWTDDLLDASITQGFNGVAFYHYFGPVGQTAFVVVGLGAYVFQAEGYDQNDPGSAMMIGGGYEFSRHWQVGAYFSSGQTSDILDYDHNHFNILVSGIAF